MAIIIVSWNTRDILADCLGSIAANAAHLQDRRVETVVIDNASGDGTAEMVRSRYAWAHVIENRENVGFAQANNQGIRVTRSRYVLLLNPDTELAEDTLGSLLDFMEAHPAAGAVGPRLLNPDRTLQRSCFPFPTLGREFWRLLHLDRVWRVSRYPVDEWPADRAQEVDHLQGACLLVRRDVTAGIGLMDEGYFMYTEEVDWCRRIREAGWAVYWVPWTTVIHYGGQSTRQAARSMFLHLYGSKLRYFRKFSGSSAGWVYKSILLLAALVRLSLLPLALFMRPEERDEQVTLAGHYAHLLRALPRM